MAKKEFRYRNKSLEELQQLSLKELAQILPSAARRKIQRGFSKQEQTFLKNLETATKPVKTHCRDMIILPTMVDKVVRVHRGNEFQELHIAAEMIGHRLGEFALTRKRVMHGDAGVGATKGSAAVSVR